ncbi:MAG: InlB B-repeat-containing protein, partial [Eubacteriales bacterium]|nr:InlB B-repeat-containing protein [Eubacteriales bacterium]
MKKRRKRLSLALALLMVLTLLPTFTLPAQAAGIFAGGSGTPEDPYRIATAEQLNNVRYNLDKSFVLAADITLSTTENWNPIGIYTGYASDKKFTGTFDGNWHTIRNLTINSSSSGGYGLFGGLDGGAKVRNLHLEAVDIDITNTSVSSWAGGLAAHADGGSAIENCYVEGSVSGKTVGGLVGAVAGATVSQCRAEVTVTSDSNVGVGGLVGSLSDLEGHIMNSFAVGSVEGYNAGGLVGIVSKNASVKYSYSTGAVSGSNVGGGLVGMNATGGQVTDSYYDSTTTGQKDTAKGTPKTNMEMQTATPFIDWNTRIWSFEEGKYPALYYQLDQYSVTYDSNAGGAAPVDSDTYCGFETVTSASSAGLIAPEGKAFKEWNTDQNGLGFGYKPLQTFGMPDKDITLYAIWDTQYTVAYTLNTGSGITPATEKHFAGDTFDAASEDGMKAPESKRFLRWNTKADGSGDSYAPGDTVTMPAGDLTLHAIWESSYVFAYDLNGTEGDATAGGLYFEDDTFSAADGTGITAPDGKQFKEWNTSPDGEGERYAPGDTVTMPAANLTLYAIWEDFQDGTKAHPFLINDYYDLYAIKDGLNLHYRQTADITLPDPYLASYEFEYLPNYCNWIPIGYDLDPDTSSYKSTPFTGTYDGGGYTISNLIIDTNAFQYAGLFGYVAADAELENINLADVEITSSYSHDIYPGYVGPLAGCNEGTIQNCTASGGIKSEVRSAVGGIVGYNTGTITGCTANCYLSGGSGSVVGGIAGYNKETIIACTASGSISGGAGSAVGGIVGYDEGTTEYSTANGCLAGGFDSVVGGIAGYDEGTIQNCTDNTSRAQADTLFFIEEEGKFYIGDPEDEIEASGLDDDCWTYDGESGILTLDNFTWVTLAPQALVIVPDADNELTIYLAQGSENSIISLFYGSDLYSGGLQVEGSLIIDGSGTLTVQSGTSKHDYVEGIYVWEDLQINGGTINATAGNALIGYSYATGIYVEGSITVSSGTVAATAGEAVGEYSYSSGIYAYQDIIISGGTVAATAGDATGYESMSSGIMGDYLVTISGGTVTATGDTQAVASDATVIINIAEGYRYWTNTSASATGAAGPVNSSTTPFINADTYKYIRIAPGLEKEHTSTSPTSPTYNADVSDGGSVPVTVNTRTGSVSLNLSSLCERLADSRNTVVTVPPIAGVSNYTVSLPSASLSGSGTSSMTLSTAIGSVTIPSNMLSGTGLTGSAGITISSADTSSLPESIQTAIGNRPLISITLTMDGRPVEWSNPDASATISIPYTPTAEELANPESIVIWYIDGSGNVVTMPSGHYDPQTGAVTFSITHFSEFAVAYNRVSFSDVAADAWYNKAVSFLAARRITTGTGDEKFSPDTALTRGQFVVMLMR